MYLFIISSWLDFGDVLHFRETATFGLQNFQGQFVIPVYKNCR